MKPAYLIVFVAMLGVGALLLFLMDSDSDRAGGRGQAVHGTRGDGPREGVSENRAPTADHPRDAERADGEIGLTILVTSGGKPVADASVVLTGPRVWRGVTDSEGRAAAPWLVPGKYAVVARKDRKTRARTIEVRGEDREVELALVDGIAIRGTIRTAGGTPIPGARIHAEPESEKTGGAPRWQLSWLAVGAHPAIFAEALARQDGSYELLLPAAASYSLLVHAPGFGGVTEPAREYDEPFEGFDFFLQPGSAVDGHVFDADGEPVPRALVVMSTNSRGTKHTTIAVTAEDGRFALTVTVESWSNLVVRARGYATSTIGTVRPPAHGLQVRLERGATYRMRFVVKGTGEPIEGVEAMLRAGGGKDFGTSDADGVVEFHNIPTTSGPYGNSWRNLTAAGSGVVPLQKLLRKMLPVDGVMDAGDIELERGATIRGRVTDSITGQGIEGAKLRAFSIRLMQFQNSPITAAVSDAQGRYELIGVPEDTVAVTATHKNFMSSRTRQDLLELVRDRKNRLLAPDQTVLQHDVQLSPAIAVHGVVLGPDGKPLPGARVSGPWRPGPGGAATATTDKEGRFGLTGYAKDQKIQLRASHRDYAGVATAFATVAGALETILKLGRAVTIQGRVVDPQGQPVAVVGVKATAAASRGRPRARGNIASAITDKDGVFVIRNSVGGERLLRFDHGHYLMRTQVIDIPQSDETFDIGTVRLERGIGLGGRVVDANGKGVPGVVVGASYQPEGGKRAPRGTTTPERAEASATSDSEGRFEMWGLKDGSYRLHAAAVGRYATSPLSRTGNFDIKIDIKDPARILGRILSGGKPVKQAWVQATQPGPNPDRPRWLASTSSGKDGRFDLGPLPPEEPFDLKIVHQQHRTLQLKGITAATAPTEIALDPGAAIRGKVVDDAGKPIGNANLSVTATDESRPDPMRWTRTGQDGSFRIAGLEPGRYRVAVTWTTGRHVPNDPVEVETDGEPLRIVLAAGKSIKGTLKVNDPERMGRVRILAIDKDGKTKGSVWILDPQTLEFNLTALAAGSYTLRAVRGWGDDGRVLTEVTGVEAGADAVEITIDG